MARHFTFLEREQLARWRREGHSPDEIAQRLGRHRSSIYRELDRGTGQRGYRPKQAQRLADERRRNSRRRHKLENEELRAEVQAKLEQCWSPDQISGRRKREHPKAPKQWLSRQTIYNWIKERQPEWMCWLRRGGRPPEKRGKLVDVVRISGRPMSINRREHYGDWEGDTIVGLGRRSALVTLVDRKSGYTRIGRAESLKAEETLRVMTKRMQGLPPELRRSMTLDNGKEFAEHPRLKKRLGSEVYFADPYKSWQRGTNENTNGLLRQYFPKRTDFTRISHREVARVEKELNERPRRRLGYKTPAEIFNKQLCRV